MGNNNGHYSEKKGIYTGYTKKKKKGQIFWTSFEKKGNYRGHPPQLKELKIHLVGDTGTGKTCSAEAYEYGVFQGLTDPTIGFWYYSKELTMQNIPTKVSIWEHSGYERNRSIISYRIPNADGILLFYDVMRAHTFLHLPEWLKYMRSLNPGAIIFIVGARSYDGFARKEVSGETGLKFAKSENLEFFECIAETGENINYVFEHMALRLLQKKGLIPFDKIEIEGKSHEYKETIEKPYTAVSEKEILCASITEKNLHTSITKKEILKIEQKTVPFEDTPEILKEGKFLSEMGTKCSGSKKVDDADITKENDNISSQFDKDTPLELNEYCNSLDNSKTVLPETKKFALSEEEMQFEGRCPAWFT